MSADNKAVFRRLIREVWNKGNLSIAGELVATNHVSHDPAIGHEDGLEGFKNHVTRVRTAFPDIEFKIEAIKDQVLGCTILREGFSQLLHDPLSGGMLRGIEVQDSPPAVAQVGFSVAIDRMSF